MARIAILEDDRPQAEQLRMWLSSDGHPVEIFDRGEALMRTAVRESYDLFILDWNVPDVSGEKVLEWLRTKFRDALPIIFTTGRDREDDIARILTRGADDYLVKPLRRLEVLARVQAVLRRAKPPLGPEDPIVLDHIRLDPADRNVVVAGEPVVLTQREFDLAALFLREPNKLFSRGHILDAVWRATAGHVTTRSVDTHVSALRKKLRLGGATGWRINSVYQHGYRLERAGRKPGL